MALECPVCLENYNLKERIPALLRCSHTLCFTCVTDITVDNCTQCPKCRHVTAVIEVSKNYGLLDVLEEQCEACLKEKKLRKCHHCMKEVCVHCFNTHARSFNEHVNKELHGVRKELRLSMETSVDSSLLMLLVEEKQKEDEAVRKVKSDIQRQREELDKLEKFEEDRIRAVGQCNRKNIVKWLDNLDSEVDSCKDFVFSAEDKLKSQYTAGCTTEEMAQISTNIKSFSKKLKSIRAEKPVCDKHDQYNKQVDDYQHLLKREPSSGNMRKGHTVENYTEIAKQLMTVQEKLIADIPQEMEADVYKLVQDTPHDTGSFAGTSQTGSGESTVDRTPSTCISTQASVNSSSTQTQKQILGERLYRIIKVKLPDLAGKITGMILKLDNAEILRLLASDKALNAKVFEAAVLLKVHQITGDIPVHI